MDREDEAQTARSSQTCIRDIRAQPGNPSNHHAAHLSPLLQRWKLRKKAFVVFVFIEIKFRDYIIPSGDAGGLSQTPSSSSIPAVELVKVPSTSSWAASYWISRVPRTLQRTQNDGSMTCILRAPQCSNWNSDEQQAGSSDGSRHSLCGLAPLSPSHGSCSLFVFSNLHSSASSRRSFLHTSLPCGIHVLYTE